MSRSSVPWRCAEYSRSARFRMDIRPEYADAQVECQPEDGSRGQPERPDQSRRGKRRRRLVRGRPPPLGIETVLVPHPRQLPDLLERHDRAARDLLARAPSTHVLFGTEEQDRRSREPDALPPAPHRQREVDDAAGLAKRAARDLALDPPAAVGARREDARV